MPVDGVSPRIANYARGNHVLSQLPPLSHNDLWCTGTVLGFYSFYRGVGLENKLLKDPIYKHSQPPRLRCSIGDTLGYKVTEALSVISNRTDAVVAYLMLGVSTIPLPFFHCRFAVLPL